MLSFASVVFIVALGCLTCPFEGGASRPGAFLSWPGREKRERLRCPWRSASLQQEMKRRPDPLRSTPFSPCARAPLAPPIQLQDARFWHSMSTVRVNGRDKLVFLGDAGHFDGQADGRKERAGRGPLLTLLSSTAPRRRAHARPTHSFSSHMFGAVKVVGDAAAAAAAERALVEAEKANAASAGAGANAAPPPPSREAWMTDPSLARQRAQATGAPPPPGGAPGPGTASLPSDRPDIDAVRPAGLSRPGDGAVSRPPPPSSVAGDGGASWRLKALQRAQAMAAEGGGSVAEVRRERERRIGGDARAKQPSAHASPSSLSGRRRAVGLPVRPGRRHFSCPRWRPRLRQGPSHRRPGAGAGPGRGGAPGGETRGRGRV